MGASTLPPPFMAELHEYLRLRGNPGPNAILLAAPSGQTRIQKDNLLRLFRKLMTLAFVRLDRGDIVRHRLVQSIVKAYSDNRQRSAAAGDSGSPTQADRAGD